MWFVKGRCGLSQLIAVIILLVIVIGAGIATFVVFSGYLSVESKQVEVSFESLVLYKSVSEPRVIFAATLKNIGNKPIKQLVIKLHNESHYMIPSISEVNPLTPGKCVGVTLTPPLIHSEYYVVGMRYSVWVYAVASDESSFSHTLSVICLGQENGTRWEEKAIYTLTILPGEYGTSDPPPGVYKYEEGTVVQVVAIPEGGDPFFDCWSLDGERVQYDYPIINVTMDMNHVLQPEFMVPVTSQMGEITLFPFYREALLNPDFELQHAFLEGVYNVGESYSADAFGDYQSLTGDGEFLFWVGAYSHEEWTLRKIRITDMKEVGCLNVSGYDAMNFVSVTTIGNYVYVAVGYETGDNKQDPFLFKIDKNNLTIVEVLPLKYPVIMPELYSDPYNDKVLWVGAMLGQEPEPVEYSLPVNGFTSVSSEWFHFGDEPWLDTDDSDLTGGSYIMLPNDPSYDYSTDEAYVFQDLVLPPEADEFSFSFTSVEVTLKARYTGTLYSAGISVWVRWSGESSWIYAGYLSYEPDHGSYTYRSIDLTDLTDWTLEKINSLEMKLVFISGNPTTIPWGNLYVAFACLNVTVSFHYPAGVSSWDPVVEKVNLESFDVEQAVIYSGVPTDGGSPCIAVDEDVLYCFAKYGGRFKVDKETLEVLQTVPDYDPYDQFPRRPIVIRGGRLYVLFSAWKLSAFRCDDLTEEFYWTDWDDYTWSWVESIAVFPEYPDSIFVLDMEPGSLIWRFEVTENGFEYVYHWSNWHSTASDAYSFWFATIDGENYIFAADWCGGDFDHIYKIRLNQEYQRPDWITMGRSHMEPLNETFSGSYCLHLIWKCRQPLFKSFPAEQFVEFSFYARGSGTITVYLEGSSGSNTWTFTPTEEWTRFSFTNVPTALGSIELVEFRISGGDAYIDKTSLIYNPSKGSIGAGLIQQEPVEEDGVATKISFWMLVGQTSEEEMIQVFKYPIDVYEEGVYGGGEWHFLAATVKLIAVEDEIEAIFEVPNGLGTVDNSIIIERNTWYNFSLIVFEDKWDYEYLWIGPSGEVILSGSTDKEDTDLGYYLLFGSQNNAFAEVYIDAVTMLLYKEKLVFREGFEEPLSSGATSFVYVERVSMPIAPAIEGSYSLRLNVAGGYYTTKENELLRVRPIISDGKLNGTAIILENVGDNPVNVVALLKLEDNQSKAYVLPSAVTVNSKVPLSTLPHFSFEEGDNVGVLTAIGNVFWGFSVDINLSATLGREIHIPEDVFVSPLEVIVTVDGVDYFTGDLFEIEATGSEVTFTPKNVTFVWKYGTAHTVVWTQSFQATVWSVVGEPKRVEYVWPYSNLLTWWNYTGTTGTLQKSASNFVFVTPYTDTWIVGNYFADLHALINAEAVWTDTGTNENTGVEAAANITYPLEVKVVLNTSEFMDSKYPIRDVRVELADLVREEGEEGRVYPTALFDNGLETATLSLVGSEEEGIANMTVTSGTSWWAERYDGNWTLTFRVVAEFEEGTVSTDSLASLILKPLNRSTLSVYGADEESTEPGGRGISQTIGAGGWLQGWRYRKSHIINPALGAGSNYQVRIVVHYGPGSDEGENVYLNEHCKTDFGDIRFTASDGKTLLDYWLEAKEDGNYAIFWVEVTDDLSMAPATIYLYYGNPEAISTSNGEATFLLFDHFETFNSSKWTSPVSNTYSGYSVSDSILNLYSGLYGKRKGWNFGNSITSLQEFPQSVMAEMKFDGRMGGSIYSSTSYKTKRSVIGFRILDSSNKQKYSIGRSHSSKHYLKITRFSDNAYLYEEKPWDGSLQGYKILSMGIYNGQIYLYEDRIFKTSVTTSLPDPWKLKIVENPASYSGNGWGEILVDWVFVRKFVDPEPEHGSWGNEESCIGLNTWPITAKITGTPAPIEDPIRGGYYYFEEMPEVTAHEVEVPAGDYEVSVEEVISGPYGAPRNFKSWTLYYPSTGRIPNYSYSPTTIITVPDEDTDAYAIYEHIPICKVNLSIEVEGATIQNQVNIPGSSSKGSGYVGKVGLFSFTVDSSGSSEWKEVGEIALEGVLNISVDAPKHIWYFVFDYWELQVDPIDCETYVTPLSGSSKDIAFTVEHPGYDIEINVQLILHYKPDNFALTVLIEPEEAETDGCSTDPSGTNYYEGGTTVSVTAYDVAGEWMFDYWELDGENVGSDNPIDIFIEKNSTLIAHFKRIVTLTIKVQPPEAEADGCTTDPYGSQQYPEGTVVEVTAYDVENEWQFWFWELNGVDIGSDNPVSIVVSEDSELVAFFAEYHNLTVTIEKVGTAYTDYGYGYVYLDPADIYGHSSLGPNPTTAEFRYAPSETVTASFDPEMGCELDHWVLDGVTYAPDELPTISMGQDHTLKAVVKVKEMGELTRYLYAVNPVPGGSYIYPLGLSYVKTTYRSELEAIMGSDTLTALQEIIVGDLDVAARFDLGTSLGYYWTDTLYWKEVNESGTFLHPYPTSPFYYSEEVGWPLVAEKYIWPFTYTTQIIEIFKINDLELVLADNKHIYNVCYEGSTSWFVALSDVQLPPHAIGLTISDLGDYYEENYGEAGDPPLTVYYAVDWNLSKRNPLYCNLTGYTSKGEFVSIINSFNFSLYPGVYTIVAPSKIGELTFAGWVDPTTGEIITREREITIEVVKPTTLLAVYTTSQPTLNQELHLFILIALATVLLIKFRNLF